jgi:hypothetical protein
MVISKLVSPLVHLGSALALSVSRYPRCCYGDRGDFILKTLGYSRNGSGEARMANDQCFVGVVSGDGNTGIIRWRFQFWGCKP